MSPHIVTARIVGTPTPGLAVWKAGDDVAGDLEDAPAVIATGDLVVLEIHREGWRWVVDRLVDHIPGHDAVSPARATPSPRPATRRRSKAPHAHADRPPGSVVIAWLPFTDEVGEPEEVPGKHRPVVVVHSPDPDHVRVRPLYDPGSAIARRSGGPRLQSWRAAGLDKPSVVGDPVDVPVRRVEQTWGRLAPVDLRQLGIHVPDARRR